MSEKEKQSKMDEVNQILSNNGIDIKFSADWGTGVCEIKYQGETVLDIKKADCTIRLGSDPYLLT